MFLEVQGNRIHYNQSGHGPAIILLHGNGEDLSIFREAAALLQDFFTVYALDLAGHGKSYRPEQLHYEAHADDVYGFIKALKLDKPVLYGFSDGGIVGMILAIKYPDLLSKLIVSGVNADPKGLSLISRSLTKARYLLTKSKKAWLMLNEPHITPKELVKIRIPTFLTVGQYDCIRPSHTKMICNSIKDCRLKIFRYCFHGSYVIHSTKIAKYILAV